MKAFLDRNAKSRANMLDAAHFRAFKTAYRVRPAHWVETVDLDEVPKGRTYFSIVAKLAPSTHLVTVVADDAAADIDISESHVRDLHRRFLDDSGGARLLADLRTGRLDTLH